MSERHKSEEEQLRLFIEEETMLPPVGPAPEPIVAQEPECPYDPDSEPGLFDWPGPQSWTAPDSETEATYFLLVENDSFGPFTISEIQIRLEEGRLTLDAYAWNQGWDEWLPLRSLFGVEHVEHAEAEAAALPAAEPPSLRLATFWVRAVAGAVDSVIIILAFLVAMIAVPPFRQWIEANSHSTMGLVRENLTLSLLTTLFYMLCFGRVGKGRTPGYALLKLRLVDQETGEAPSPLQCLLWCIGSIAIWVGWITYWFDPKLRMLHNITSKTIVIDQAP